MLLGASTAILNYSDYSAVSMQIWHKNLGYKAENIIKVAKGKYWGFDDPNNSDRVRTALQWRKDMMARFNELGDPQRYVRRIKND